tara:strand:+ start:448 stop:639 length:192 start_codon:yes stop_codon:yes gene_type:complete
MTSPWVTTEELANYLRCSVSTINRNKDMFSYGIHYRKLNPSKKTSKILWHLQKVEAVFCRPVR